MTDLVMRLRAVSTSEIETMYNLTREAANRIRELEKLHLQASENAQMHYSMSAKWAQRARAFESLLQDAQNYILNKAARHDLNWRDGHAIIERIGDAMNAAPQEKSVISGNSGNEASPAVAAPETIPCQQAP